MRNKRKEYFVKWMGYPDKFNSWVPAESVKKSEINVFETYQLVFICVLVFNMATQFYLTLPSNSSYSLFSN